MRQKNLAIFYEAAHALDPFWRVKTVEYDGKMQILQSNVETSEHEGPFGKYSLTRTVRPEWRF